MLSYLLVCLLKLFCSAQLIIFTLRLDHTLVDVDGAVALSVAESQQDIPLVAPQALRTKGIREIKCFRMFAQVTSQA